MKKQLLLLILMLGIGLTPKAQTVSVSGNKTVTVGTISPTNYYVFMSPWISIKALQNFNKNDSLIIKSRPGQMYRINDSTIIVKVFNPAKWIKASEVTIANQSAYTRQAANDFANLWKPYDATIKLLKEYHKVKPKETEAAIVTISDAVEAKMRELERSDK